jgi:hypothetical protein
MKRIIIAADDDHAHGVYDDPNVQCGWYWDSESRQIVDFVGVAECVVGYAETLAEVIA